MDYYYEILGNSLMIISPLLGLVCLMDNKDFARIALLVELDMLYYDI